MGCLYQIYQPDRLGGRPIALDAATAGDVADSERAIQRFNERARGLVDTESLARLLLRAESVASSRIEGLEIGARRLLRAGVARELGEATSDVTANEILGNIDAMAFAIAAVDDGAPITIPLLLEMHRRLLDGTRLADYAGTLRSVQNWIGGSSYNPCSAAFVPPQPELVVPLLEDLCAFCNGDLLPPVAQAAIAHAQFETIHPFVDGNGRIGRALIQLILRRRGLASRVLPPISLILATNTTEYIEGQAATRYDGPASAGAAHDGMNLWIGHFAAAAMRSVRDASAFEERLDELESGWRERLGSIRKSSAVDLLLRHLPALPVLTVGTAAEAIGRSFLATNQAVARLVDASILTSARADRRNRVFEARSIIAAFTDFERRLASTAGDTRIAPPVRRVAYRRS
jgi:Fic family protein